MEEAERTEMKGKVRTYRWTAETGRQRGWSGPRGCVRPSCDPLDSLILFCFFLPDQIFREGRTKVENNCSGTGFESPQTRPRKLLVVEQLRCFSFSLVMIPIAPEQQTKTFFFFFRSFERKNKNKKIKLKKKIQSNVSNHERRTLFLKKGRKGILAWDSIEDSQPNTWNT